MTVKNLKGTQQPHGDWTTLMSPMEEITQTTCLKFQYYTRYIDIKVYTYTYNHREKILDILHDGQKKAWHTASVTLEPGYYGILWKLVFGEIWTEEYAGIDDIILTNGTCADEGN